RRINQSRNAFAVDRSHRRRGCSSPGGDEGLGAAGRMTHTMTHMHLDLAAPPPAQAGNLRVTALGGLGEIGRNMTVFELDGKLLIVDCGVHVPEDRSP